ncbi:unnamed protein product [Orchesella dallaii]|uniref:Chitin-binding type-2 domain-containing protein n=1 Tax=Orchesella dallaii TaxID=48710 RepID=A0ABP1R3C7_9HEXA
MVWARACILAALLNISRTVFGADQLQSYNVDKSTITVSGLSSGGAMAMQYHVAFSSDIQGAAIFGGIPYACAKGGYKSIPKCLFHPDTINVLDLVQEINDLSSANKIDNASNLDGKNVFVFHGTKDTIVKPGCGRKLEEVYKIFGGVTKTEYKIEAGHGFPTNFYGGECGSVSAATHFINNCNYHGSHIAMNYLLGGSLASPASSAEGQFLEYDQTEFGANNVSSMGSTGYVYVPKGCQDRKNQCKLHIAFHGCLQSKTNLNDTYATKTGYLEVAEANNIIVLFPQTSPYHHKNHMACWDFWGYLNSDFLNKDGVHMKAVHAMQLRVSTCETSTGCNPSGGSEPPVNKTPMTRGPTVPTGASGECENSTIEFQSFPGDCRYYILCGCGANVRLECAPGLYFDPAIGKCNFMQLVSGCNTKLR